MNESTLAYLKHQNEQQTLDLEHAMIEADVKSRGHLHTTLGRMGYLPLKQPGRYPLELCEKGAARQRRQRKGERQ